MKISKTGLLKSFSFRMKIAVLVVRFVTILCKCTWELLCGVAGNTYVQQIVSYMSRASASNVFFTFIRCCVRFSFSLEKKDMLQSVLFDKCMCCCCCYHVRSLIAIQFRRSFYGKVCVHISTIYWTFCVNGLASTVF